MLNLERSEIQNYISYSINCFKAFKLFDIDGDGVITIDELKSLISKVGGDMSEADAAALIHAADKDGNMGIDFSEFAKLWEALHGEGEVRRDLRFTKTLNIFIKGGNKKRIFQTGHG